MDPNHFIDKLKLISIDENMEKYCETLYLVGSYSRGEFNNTSDVDLIIIVRNTNHIQKVLDILEVFRQYVSEYRKELDVRIFTKSSFKDAFNGIDHFSLWSSVVSGLLILGNPVQVSLKLPLVKLGISYWIDSVSESMVSLEYQSHFEGACYVLYSALVWIYFVERYLCLENKALQSKQTTLSFYFEDMESIIRFYYDKAVRKIRKKTVVPLKSKIKIKGKNDWSELEYLKLYRVAEKIIKYGNATYHRIMKKHGD